MKKQEKEPIKITFHNPFSIDKLKGLLSFIVVITIPIWYPIVWIACGIPYWWACFDYWIFYKFRNKYDDRYFLKRQLTTSELFNKYYMDKTRD